MDSKLPVLRNGWLLQRTHINHITIPYVTCQNFSVGFVYLIYTYHLYFRVYIVGNRIVQHFLCFTNTAYLCSVDFTTFRLCDGGAIEAQIFNFVQKFNRRIAIVLCSFAPLLQNPYILIFYDIKPCSR